MLQVSDDGRPPARPRRAGGHGLAGMRERLALFGGELSAGPDAGGRLARPRGAAAARGAGVSIRVLLADDQALLRTGFRMILQAQPDLEVVGEAVDGADAVRQAAALRPDVVLMDVRMPVMDGIAGDGARSPRRRRVAGAGADHLRPRRVRLRRAAGRRERLPAQGRAAGRAGRWRSGRSPPGTPSSPRGSPASCSTGSPLHTPGPGAADAGPAAVLAALTDREREVFGEVARGLSNAEIAGRLHLSEATVKTHLTRVLAKLRLRDRVQMVIFAYEHGSCSRTDRRGVTPALRRRAGRGGRCALLVRPATRAARRSASAGRGASPARGRSSSRPAAATCAASSTPSATTSSPRCAAEVDDGPHDRDVLASLAAARSRSCGRS